MPPNSVSTVTDKNPNEKLPIPSWVQEDYFKKILENDYPDLKKIVKFTPIAATGPGENYTSIMLRVFVDLELNDGSEKQASYILKTTLEGAKSNQVLSNMNLFPKEREMYQIILPQFEKLYAEAGKLVSFGAQCKFAEKSDDRETIVMEDLKQRTFQNVDRLLGLDSIHMEEALKKLAEFHAVSAVHHERFGPYTEQFQKSFFAEENREFLEKLAESKRTLYLSVLEKWGDCEKYIKFWPSPKETMQWFVEKSEPCPNELTVLNHGDCWSNNIMFQYKENGDIDETYFVDFQMCKWGSPTQDLYYLITSSAAFDIRVKEFDKFMRVYYENLAENLRLLKYSKPIPSLKEIHILMINYSFWATSTLPAIALDPDDNANMDNILIDEEFRRASLLNPRYVKAMKQLLPWWENRGVFEINV